MTTTPRVDAIRKGRPVLKRHALSIMMLSIVTFAVLAAAQWLSPEAAQSQSRMLHPCMTAEQGTVESRSEEEKEVERVFVRFLSCHGEQARTGNDCRRFTAQAIRDVYGIEIAAPDHDPPTTSELAASIAQGARGWVLLGEARDQRALKEAQRRADSGHAALAVLSPPDGPGHVALILPGPLKPSPQWRKLATPNAASFHPTRPLKSFTGCKLSYAFRSPDGVRLYASVKKRSR
ncbi:hypothetical protein [Candidatus Nitrospira bockiana]